METVFLEIGSLGVLWLIAIIAVLIKNKSEDKKRVEAKLPSKAMQSKTDVDEFELLAEREVEELLKDNRIV